MTLHSSMISQQGCCILNEACARWGHIQQGGGLSQVLPLCRDELPTSLGILFLLLMGMGKKEKRASLMRLRLDSAISLLMRHWAYCFLLLLKNKKDLLIIQQCAAFLPLCCNLGKGLIAVGHKVEQANHVLLLLVPCMIKPLPRL